MDSADCMRNYKSLANVERAFRSLKTSDLKVRPIHHHTADRVRAHIFLCMLAYYVDWHMRQAWAPLMFADTDQLAKATRNPVAPATRSKTALTKSARHTLDDGTPAHSFSNPMAELATIVRNTCGTPNAAPEAPTFEVLTTPNAKQPRAQPDSADPVVDRTRNADLTPSRAKTNSPGPYWNFGLADAAGAAPPGGAAPIFPPSAPPPIRSEWALLRNPCAVLQKIPDLRNCR